MLRRVESILAIYHSDAEDVMITVADVMTTEPYTLKGTDVIDTARRLMTEKNIRHIPIVSDDGVLRGLVTHRDLLSVSISNLVDMEETDRRRIEASTPLEQIMTTKLSVVSEKMNLREAALRLQSHKYGCLPVVSKGILKGIITDSDFVAVAINLLEQLEITEPLDESF
jgi:CBS domain-containing membrane protein